MICKNANKYNFPAAYLTIRECNPDSHPSIVKEIGSDTHQCTECGKTLTKHELDVFFKRWKKERDEFLKSLPSCEPYTLTQEDINKLELNKHLFNG